MLLLTACLFLITLASARSQYDMDPSSASAPSDSYPSAERNSNLFVVGIAPSNQIFHKKQQSLSQVPSTGPKGPKPVGGPPDEGRYRIPWIDVLPRRDTRGRRVKKLPGQSPGHIQPKPNVKNPIPVDTSPTSREPRGRDDNHYDIPLIGK